MVFFTGHGERSAKDKRTYLLPRDANREKLEDTGYPLVTSASNLRLPRPG